MDNSKVFSTNHLKKNIGQLAVRSGAVLVIAQGIQFFLSLASNIILARLLLPEDFGLVAMVLPFIGLLGFLKTSGLDMATIQQEEINHKQISTLFWINIGMGFALMLCLIAIAPLMVYFFKREELLLLTWAFGGIMFISSISIQHGALLKRQMAFKELSFSSISGQVVGLISAVIAVYFGCQYWALVIMPFTTTVTTGLFVWFFCRWMPGLPQRGTGIRKMLGFGAGLTINNFIYKITQSVDGIIIGRFCGAITLGYYSRGLQLYLMPLTRLMQPLQGVAVPTLCRLMDDPIRYAKAFLRVQEKLVMLTAPFAVLLISFGDLIIVFLLGEKWMEAGIVLRAFAIGGLVIPISSSLSWLLVSQGRSKALAAWAPVGLVIRLVGIISGLPWGVLGIAISLSVVQYISCYLFAIWTCRKSTVTVSMIVKNFIPQFTASVVAIAIGMLLRQFMKSSNVNILLFGSLLVFTAYCISIWMIPSGRLAIIDACKLGKLMLSRKSD